MYGLLRWAKQYGLASATEGSAVGELMTRKVEARTVMVKIFIDSLQNVIARFMNADGSLTQEGLDLSAEATETIVQKAIADFKRKADSMEIELPLPDSTDTDSEENK